jgi:hypothetical protein
MSNFNDLYYDFELGQIIGRKEKTTNKGYKSLKYNNKDYLVHRLAWFLYYGEWPKGEIDHINGNKSDNRICNLRDVTHKENCQNLLNHRNGKLVGASYHKSSGKWQASITKNNKLIYLGLFNSEQEAHEVYKGALNG